MANNLDRLFREGIDQYEVTPKAESWSAVQGQLTKKKKIGWIPMSIAAAIILMITATLIVKNYQVEQNNSTGRFISSVDFPQKVMSPEKIQLPADGVNVKYQIVRNNYTEPGSSAQTVVKPEKKEDQMTNFPMETIQIVAIGKITIDELPKVHFNYDFDVIKIEKPTVKITYIAENEATEKKKKLGEFINTLAKESSPVEILADIRDAKDNIFSRN